MKTVEIFKILTKQELIKLKEIVNQFDNINVDVKNDLIPEWIEKIEKKNEFNNILRDNVHDSLYFGLNTIFLEFVKKTNIKYSAAFGTMLGAVRESKIIDYDDDIDIFVDADEFKLHSSNLIEIANLNGWVFLYNSWPGESVIGKTFSATLTPKEPIIFDFGFFMINFFPKIEFFPVIKISDNEKIENIMIEINDRISYNESKDINWRLTEERNRARGKYSLNFEIENSQNNLEKLNTLYNKNNVSKNSIYIPFTNDILRVGKFYPFKTRKIRFKDKELLIPINAEELLKKIYGNWEKPAQTHLHIFSSENII